MKSIRSVSFAAVLTLGAFGQLVGLAHAQSSMHGKFSLPYEVGWENTVVPAGSYEFSVRPTGSSEFLVLQKVGGPSLGFLVLAQPTDPATSADFSKLVLVTREGMRFASSMQLKQLGVTLSFAVPDEPSHYRKQMARVETMAASSAAR
jgi:hypothetical protein